MWARPAAVTLGCTLDGRPPVPRRPVTALHPERPAATAKDDVMTLSSAADGPGGTGRGPAAGTAARDHVTALAAVVEDLAGQFDLRPLLERILRHAADLLGCDSGSICTVDQAAGNYRKEIDLGVACRSGAQFPLTEGVTGEILRARGPVTFAEYSDVRGGHIAPAERAQLHATIGVPIRWSGSVIGTCIVFSRDPGRRFGPDDLTLLELFAGHAGLAMVNARLHAQAAELTRAEAAGLERERVVRDVHDSVARALASVVLHLDSAERPGPAPVGAANSGSTPEPTRDADPGADRVIGDPPAAGPLDLARQAAWSALQETGRPLPGGRSGTEREAVTAAGTTGATHGTAAEELERHLRAEVDAARAAGLDIRMVVAGSRRPVPAAVAAELLALGRQAVGNIVAHADARTARVGLVFRAAEVVLFVQDDGVGFDVDQRPRPDGSRAPLRGPGLPELADEVTRTEQLGGRVQIDTTPGWGTTIRAAIPDRPAQPEPGSDGAPGSGRVRAGRVRALVVEHRPLVSAGVVSVLRGDGDHIHVVGQTVGAADTVAAVGLLRPDVLLIDAALPAGAAVLTAQVRSRDAAVAVIALGGQDPAETQVREMVRAGACAVVLLDADGADFRQAVTAAAGAQDRHDRPDRRPIGVHPASDMATGRRSGLLTPREQEVRALVSKGLPDKGIAAALHISVKTVEKHVGAALRKTGARNRTELAALSRA